MGAASSADQGVSMDKVVKGRLVRASLERATGGVVAIENDITLKVEVSTSETFMI